MELSDEIYSVLNTLEFLSDEEECKGVLAGLEDVRAGRVRSLSEIQAELNKKYRPMPSKINL
jgi:hypothetical protein